jgi:hypothetical protein
MYNFLNFKSGIIQNKKEKVYTIFSLSLTNVLDRLEMADLYQINSLYSACGQLIQSNLKTVKKDAKWLELKKKAPELAFAILEDVEEFGNGKVNINKYTIGNTSNICRLKVL